jgi:tetratricopeptide (TPR) repeat protein
VWLLQGQVREAIESYRAALALDPGLVAGYLNLARAYAVAGEVADARRVVGAALAVDPSNEDARQLERQLAALPRETRDRRRE